MVLRVDHRIISAPDPLDSLSARKRRRGVLPSNENKNPCEQRDDAGDDAGHWQRRQRAKTSKDQPDAKQEHSHAARQGHNGHVSTSAAILAPILLCAFSGLVLTDTINR